MEKRVCLIFTNLLHYLNQFRVAPQSLPQGMSATLLPLRGINQTGTGTLYENDTRSLDTLFCDRFTGSWSVERRGPQSDTLDCSRRNQAYKSRHCNAKTDGAVVKSEVKNLKETIDKGFENVETRIGNVETRFDSIEKNFDRLNNIIIACIGIPLAILASGATVWGILAHRRSRKDQILERQIETLTQEIERLKQQRIVQP